MARQRAFSVKGGGSTLAAATASNNQSAGVDDTDQLLTQEPNENSPTPSHKDLRIKLPRKLTQDVIHVTIPLHETVDLGIALSRTRSKRIKALLEVFPELNPKKVETKEVKDDGKGESTLDDNGDEKEKRTKKKKPVLKHVPQQNEYSNIVDYLEAKYVQGVMVDDGDDNGESGGDAAAANSDDEGAGSVYSQNSFFDDEDLRRNVAGQVVSQITTTKLELANEENDFFVNVGELEVEETEMTKEKYDPLKDTDDKDPKKRKRKKKDTSKVTTPELPSKKKAKTSTTATAGKKNDGGKTSTSAVPKKPDDQTPKTTISAEELGLAEIEAADKKVSVDKLADQLKKMIRVFDESILPRRKTTEKVSIACPVDKKGGDQIYFANPHSQGQRLRVTIPASTKPGGKFNVTVPVAHVDDGADHNKLGRDFYELLDDYARGYDELCDTLQIVNAAKDIKYAATTEKRNKFDSIVPLFPKDTLTLIDKTYLQKMLRRARQNKYKRNQTAKKQKEAAAAEIGTVPASKPPEESQVKDESKDKDDQRVAEDDQPTTIRVPELSIEFSSRDFDVADFPQ